MNYSEFTKKQLIELVKELTAVKGESVTGSKIAYQECLKVVKNHKQENFIAIYLDNAYKVIESRLVTLGTLNQSLVHPREVFAPAIELRAASIIVGHNHPSGNTEPSNEDILVTKRLIEAGKILGIDILDHIIFTANSHTSLKAENLM